MPYFSFIIVISRLRAHHRTPRQRIPDGNVYPIKILNISCNSSFNNVLYFLKILCTLHKISYYIISYISLFFKSFTAFSLKKSKNKSPFIRATVNYCHRLTNPDPDFTVFVFFCLFGQGLGSTEKSGSQRQKLSPKLCNVSPKTQQFFGCFVDFPFIRHS